MSEKRTWRHHRPHLLAGLAVLIVVVSLIARHDRMGAVERSIFTFFYGLPDSWRMVGVVITQLGSAWALIGIVALLLIIRWRGDLAVLVLRNGTLAYFATVLVKAIVNRPRPVGILDHIVQRESFVQGTGFPSGHTAMATAIALTVLPFVPRRVRWVPIVVIGLVASSRMYLGVHAPLDVLGGFVLGAIVVVGGTYLPRVGVDKKR